MKIFKHIISLSLLSLSLAACSSQLPQQIQRPATQLQSQRAAQNAPAANSDPRLFETFKGYQHHSQYDKSGLAEMLMTARSLLGKTFDNRNSATRYHMFYRNQDSFLATAHGPIRLGRDNVLYVEDMNFSNGQTSYQYYRLGSFKLAPGSADGAEVAFELDRGNSVKMKWRGINPMDHDELHLTIDASVKPVSKPKEAFL